MITKVITAPVPLIKNMAGAGYCMTYAIDNLRGCEGAMLKQQALGRTATRFVEAAALHDFHTEIILAGICKEDGSSWNSDDFFDGLILSKLMQHRQMAGGYIVAALHVGIRYHGQPNHFIMLVIGPDHFFIIDSLHNGIIFKVPCNADTKVSRDARELLKFDALHRIGLEVMNPNTNPNAHIKSYSAEDFPHLCL